jgi:hypothetical protein
MRFYRKQKDDPNPRYRARNPRGGDGDGGGVAAWTASTSPASYLSYQPEYLDAGPDPLMLLSKEPLKPIK